MCQTYFFLHLDCTQLFLFFLSIDIYIGWWLIFFSMKIFDRSNCHNSCWHAYKTATYMPRYYRICFWLHRHLLENNSIHFIHCIYIILINSNKWIPIEINYLINACNSVSNVFFFKYIILYAQGTVEKSIDLQIMGRNFWTIS